MAGRASIVVLCGSLRSNVDQTLHRPNTKRDMIAD